MLQTYRQHIVKGSWFIIISIRHPSQSHDARPRSIVLWRRSPSSSNDNYFELYDLFIEHCHHCGAAGTTTFLVFVTMMLINCYVRDYCFKSDWYDFVVFWSRKVRWITFVFYGTPDKRPDDEPATPMIGLPEGKFLRYLVPLCVRELC